jgi:hypothetical protein
VKVSKAKTGYYSIAQYGTKVTVTHFPAPATSSREGNRMDILLRGMFPTRKLSVDPFSTGSTSPAKGWSGRGRGGAGEGWK